MFCITAIVAQIILTKKKKKNLSHLSVHMVNRLLRENQKSIPNI